MSTSDFAYFGLGAAVGAAAAILLAPRPGSETRQYLRSKAGDGTDYLAARASDLQDAAAQAIKRGKKAVQHQSENLSAAMDAGVQSFREVVQTAP